MMKTNNNAVSFIFLLLVLTLSSFKSDDAQSFTAVRIEGGPVSVKKASVWSSCNSAKAIGVLSFADSIIISGKEDFVKFLNADNEQYTLYGPYRGTMREAYENYCNRRRGLRFPLIFSREKNEDKIGEPAMVFRGEEDTDAVLSSISKKIKQGGAKLNSKTIEIRRSRCQDGYYYVLKNMSEYDLFVSVMEVSGNVYAKVADDLLNIRIPANEVLELSDYAFGNKRIRNGYYAIASINPVLQIECLDGKTVDSFVCDIHSNDMNIIVAGHR